MNYNVHIFFIRTITGYKLRVKKNCLFIILFVLSISLAPASPLLPLNCTTPSPQLNCVSVAPNGDVTLTWTTPPSTLNFNSYHIYQSSSLAGPYADVDSIFLPTTTTATIAATNANKVPVYFYIQARCTGYIYSPPADTLKTMHLSVTSPLNSGTAVLTWNPIADPVLPSSSNTYSIYQEYPVGTWTLIGTESNVNGNSVKFIDTILVCNGAINYQVQLNDNSGCTSVSSDSAGVFQNSIAPATPVFDTLSVDNNNNTLLSWTEKPSPNDVKGYEVYRFNGVSWVVINTVFGVNNTSFTYTLSSAASNSEQYRIVAIANCPNTSSSSHSFPVFSTIYLTAAADICKRSAILSWVSPYPPTTIEGLTNTGGYIIYQSTVGQAGPYTFVSTLPAGTYSDTVSGLAPNTTYYFKVMAVNVAGNKTASSNRIKFYSSTPKPPAFLYLRTATVVNANQVNLTCHVDVAASISYYKVFRAIDSGNVAQTYVQIGTIPSSTTTPIMFSDVNAATNENSYSYKIMVVDSCFNNGMESNIGQTILLTATGYSYVFKNVLQWNNYGGWPGGVSSYNIYRGADGVINPVPIANVPAVSGVNSYTDNTLPAVNDDGTFNYAVEGVEATGNAFGFIDSSSSNVANAYQNAVIYIPNAFDPGGDYIKNKTFIPVMAFVAFTGYTFSVFDRFGGQLFSTTDVNQGWDGTYKGTNCELGVYGYLIQLQTATGDYQTFKGCFTLLR